MDRCICALRIVLPCTRYVCMCCTSTNLYVYLYYKVGAYLSWQSRILYGNIAIWLGLWITPPPKQHSLHIIDFWCEKKLNFLMSSMRVDVFQPFRKGQKIHCLGSTQIDFRYLSLYLLHWLEFWVQKSGNLYSPNMLYPAS